MKCFHVHLLIFKFSLHAFRGLFLVYTLTFCGLTVFFFRFTLLKSSLNMGRNCRRLCYKICRRKAYKCSLSKWKRLILYHLVFFICIFNFNSAKAVIFGENFLSKLLYWLAWSHLVFSLNHLQQLSCMKTVDLRAFMNSG